MGPDGKLYFLMIHFFNYTTAKAVCEMTVWKEP